MAAVCLGKSQVSTHTMFHSKYINWEIICEIYCILSALHIALKFMLFIAIYYGVVKKMKHKKRLTEKKRECCVESCLLLIIHDN